MLKYRGWVFVKEHLIHGHVKCGNDFLGVVDQLTVQVGVKLAQVVTVDVQEWLPNHIDLKTIRMALRQ